LTDEAEFEPISGSYTEEEKRRIRALRAYMNTPGPATEAALLESAPGPFGEWLKRAADQGPLRAKWAVAEPVEIRRVYALWYAHFRRRVVAEVMSSDRLITAISNYVDCPTARAEAAIRATAPPGDGDYWVHYADLLGQLPESARRERLGDPERGSVAARTNRGRLRRGGIRWTTRTVVGFSVVAATLVLVPLLAGVFPGGTPPRAITHPSATLVAWRITSLIDQSAWQPSGSAGTGNTAAKVTCPSSSTCYAAKEGTGQGPAVVEVSVDGGLTWQASALPAGWRLTSSLACPTRTECLAGGVETSPLANSTIAASIVVTTDGGVTWSVRPLPPSVGQVTNVACATAGLCVAAGYGPTMDPSSFGSPIAVSLSGAGSVSGAVVNLPQPFVAASPGGLACAPGGGVCVLVGITSVPTPSSGATAGTGVVLRSTDGGRTWSRADIPATVARVRAVSCPSADRCVGIGNGPSSATGPDASDGPSEALTTDDSGRTWSLLGGSSELPQSTLTSISCPSATACWAVGQTLATRSGVIVATDDAGTSWATVQLPTVLSPAQQRSTGFTHLDIESVSSVSCPEVSTCVAIAAPANLALGNQQMVLRRDGP
jgi:hypothetical protein